MTLLNPLWSGGVSVTPVPFLMNVNVARLVSLGKGQFRSVDSTCILYVWSGIIVMSMVAVVCGPGPTRVAAVTASASRSEACAHSSRSCG